MNLELECLQQMKINQRQTIKEIYSKEEIEDIVCNSVNVSEEDMIIFESGYRAALDQLERKIEEEKKAYDSRNIMFMLYGNMVSQGYEKYKEGVPNLREPDSLAKWKDTEFREFITDRVKKIYKLNN